MKTAKKYRTSSFSRWTSDANKIGDRSRFQWFPPVAKAGQVTPSPWIVRAGGESYQTQPLQSKGTRNPTKSAARIQAIFAQALELKSPAEREQYLTEACQGDPDSRREVESLLRAEVAKQKGTTLKSNISMSIAAWLKPMAGHFRTACATRLLPFVLLLTMPAAVKAQFNYMTYNGAITITGYTGAGGAVTIPETINGLPVNSIGNYAFYNCSSLTGVTMPNSITRIGTGAFYYCISLTSATMGNSVTNIGDLAFSKCTALTSVTFGPNITSLGVEAFHYCASLTKVSIPNRVINIADRAFQNCTSLTSLTLGTNVTLLGVDAFQNCSNLTSVTIPNSVTRIADRAYQNCTSLTSTTIGNGATNIGPLTFSACNNLTAITVNALNPSYSSVAGILFNKNQTALIQCPGGKPGSYSIPSTVTNVESLAFSWCANLTGVTIPSSVTSIGPCAFSPCARLAAITVNDLNPMYSSVAGVLFNRNQTTLIQFPAAKAGSYVIPNTVTNIGSQSFLDCTNLTGVTIPNSVTYIGSSAFSYCRRLPTVTIPDSVVYLLGGAFSYCTSLTNATIGNGVIPLGFEAFQFCTSLASVTLGNSVTDLGNSAFASCSNLTGVSIPNSVTSIGSSAFRSCTRLTTVTIPDSVAAIGSWAFDSCTSLTNFSLGKSVTYIGYGWFSHCSSLSTVTIPNSVTGIGQSAFESCSNLVSVTIPNSVSSIANSAFRNCTRLANVTIPNSVTTIGEYAFEQCTGLNGVYFKGNAFYPFPSITNLFGNTTATIYYLPGTTGWDATFGGRPTVLWNPRAQASDASFGVRTNRFGFAIAGTANIPIVIEAGTNLASPVWIWLQSCTLTNGCVYFSDPQSTNYPTRFYRLRSP